jgi:hypothetical protein
VSDGEGFDLGTPVLPFTSPVRSNAGDTVDTCWPIGGAQANCVAGQPLTIPCGVQWGNTPGGVCGSVISDGPDHMYKMIVPAGATSLTITTCSASTNHNNLISVVDASGVNRACSDTNNCPAGVLGSDAAIGREIIVSLPTTPGELLFIVVAGRQSTFFGDYVLSISMP